MSVQVEDQRRFISNMLVRRVAEAICMSRSCEGIECCQQPANRGRLAKDCPVKNGGYDDAAVAALGVVQEES